MKKTILYISLGLICTVALFFYADTVQSNIANNVLRLHVLANSDTEEDQALKLKVRDRILREGGTLFAACNSPEDTRRVFAENQTRLRKAAMDEVQKEGYDYPVSVQIEKTFFPSRQYKNIALPAGEYEAVRVEIGEAEGKNWWCVMFPPLCFVDGSVDQKQMDHLQEKLGSDYDILTPDGDLDVRIRFKLVDVLENTSHAIREALKNC
ncbi:MAG: stage II sporulation protein R [Clostridia bacterium]|nr:stage II sporulation protein R [Clostridia bacterium]